MLKEIGLNHKIRWVGITAAVKTPGVPDNGGRRDVFFLVHEKDISQKQHCKTNPLGVLVVV